MKTVPVATVIRTALPDGIWEKGWSKTYHDTSYTKTKKKQRWATKDIKPMTDEQVQAVTAKLKAAFPSKEYYIQVFHCEVCVYLDTPVKIVDLY